jgi:methylglutaconyl-CoA hydratase
LVGEAKAKELIFLAKILSGQEAAACGLVNSCVDGPRDEARAWAATILAHGPLGVKGAKAAIEGGRSLSLPAALDWERKCYQRVLESEDRVEGLKAFAEKRSPDYKGR